MPAAAQVQLRTALPKIILAGKPKGLTFHPPKSALERWDRSIQAKGPAAPAEASLDIMGPIGDDGWSDGGVTAGMVKRALDEINGAPLRITLNSPGGDAFEGVAIYNLLREYRGRITVNVIGLAASAASVIAMAGDRIEIGEAAFLMIHSAWGVVIGNQQDMSEFAGVLAQLDGAIAELYARRTGMPVADVLALMQKETWMTGTEAVDKGFADVSVTDDDKDKKKAKAHVTPIFSSHQAPAAILAASGDRNRPVVRLSAHTPGASGKPLSSPPKEKDMKTIAEQIAAFEAKRVADTDRRAEIQNAAINEGRNKTEAEKQEFDQLSAEIVSIDSELVDLRMMEKQAIKSATAVTAAAGADPKAATAARGAQPFITVKANIEPGVKLARFAMAQIAAQGNLPVALQMVQNNRRWMDQTPEVAQVMMAAVAAGDTATAGWASELVYTENLTSEFIEYLRPLTILGRIPNLTKVPFNIRIPVQTGGGTGYWVGEGKPVPMSKMTTASQPLGIAKAGGLMAITEELARSSTPAAELFVRNELAKVISAFLDVQFIDPSVAEVANDHPASITNGVTPVAPTGTTAATLRADLQTLWGGFVTNNQDMKGAALIMSGTMALAVSDMVNALGQPVFPNVDVRGGDIKGIPVIVSNHAQIAGSPGERNMIILVNAPEIFLADDGQVAISASSEASIQMLDNPTNQSTGATVATTVVSMYQTSSLAIKAIRFINWRKARTTSVAYIQDAAYVA